MSLFEIDINSDFKITNCSVFLTETDFKTYYKKNNLNAGYDDDIGAFLPDNELLKIDSDSLLDERYSTPFLTAFVHTDIYAKKSETIYPEWLLFYIAIKKTNALASFEIEFLEYVELVKYIAEIRYKKFVVRNTLNYINYEEIKDTDEIRLALHAEFIKYIEVRKFDVEFLFSALYFLNTFYNELQVNERYKIMWNLEIYIIEAMKLLLDHDIELEEIYKRIGGGTYSILHQVHLVPALYIKESKNYFSSFLPKINSIFGEVSLEEFFTTIHENTQYSDVLFSYLELTRRFNANKRSEIVMGAMIKGVVLGMEEIIKDHIKELSKPFDQSLEVLAKDVALFQQLRIKEKDYSSGATLLRKLNILIANEDSIEKYLAVYYSGRNYLAHYNIDMEKFFWGEDGKRLVVSNVLDSIMIILYRMEIMKRQAQDSSSNETV